MPTAQRAGVSGRFAYVSAQVDTYGTSCYLGATSGGQLGIGRTTTVTDMSRMTWSPNALAA
jgi:hypothetical protein